MSSVSSVSIQRKLEFGPHGQLEVCFENGTLSGMSFAHLHAQEAYWLPHEFSLNLTNLKVCRFILEEMKKKEHWHGVANDVDTKHILLNIGMHAFQCQCETEATRKQLLADLHDEPSKIWMVKAIDEINSLCTTPLKQEDVLFLAVMRHLPAELKQICIDNKYFSGKPIKVTSPNDDADMNVGFVKIELCDGGVKIKSKIKEDPSAPFTDGKAFLFMDECLVELENNEPVQIANSKAIIQSIVNLLTPAEVDKSDSSEDES